jgi:hypothetical protein
MKVWIVSEMNNGELEGVIGVFASKETAEKFVKPKRKRHHVGSDFGYPIEEWSVTNN